MSPRSSNFPRVLVGLAFGLLVCGAAARALADPSVLLEPKYPPGKTHYAEDHIEVTLSVSGETFPEPLYVRNGYRLGLLETVQSAWSGGARVKLRIDRIAVRMEAAAFLPPVAWDSDGVDPPDGTPALGEALRPLLGRTFFVTLDEKAHITAVSDLAPIEERLGRIEQSFPAVMPLRSQLEDQAFQKSWNEYHDVFYPYRRVEVGDTWTHRAEAEFAPVGKLVVSHGCLLEEVFSEGGNRMARIAHSASFAMEAARSSGPLPMDLVFQSGSLTGEAIFDIARGRYRSNASRAELRLGARLPGDDGADAMLDVAARVIQGRVLMSVGQRNQQKRENRQGDE